MRGVLSPEEMRNLEARYLCECGASSWTLMETAAQSVADLLWELGGAGRTVIFACGPGNNGGDGYEAAYLHARRGGHSVILSPYGAHSLTGDARRAFEHARGLADFRAMGDLLPTPFAWVDALFGIGLARPLDAKCAYLSERMELDRRSGARVVAVDIASGLDAQTGAALGARVRATHTVTFEAPKYGHLLSEGLEATGELRVCTLGIPASFLPDAACKWLETSDFASHMRPRARNSHKGHYGHLLIIAGSVGMAGAAILAARAALRSGVGLVTIACPQSIVPILQTAVPCAMCAPLPEENGAIGRGARSALEAAIQGKTALAIGPGLSRAADPLCVETALACGLPAVVDADALNIIAREDGLRRALCAEHVLTPHPGEAARLLGRKVTDPILDARALHALGPVALLKGASSVIAGKDTYIRTAGTSGLAKGGSGDVLTGMLGALLAQGYAAETAAWMAAELHGLLGERTQARLGAWGMTAADLIDDIPYVFENA